MPILLQLGRQGAAAGGLVLHIEHLADLRQRGHGEPWPVHRRVGQWLIAIQQVTVLDEQQAADYQRRNAGEIGITLLWIAELIEGRATAIADAEAGLAFLDEGWEQAATAVGHQCRREAGLLADQEVALLQALQHQWQVGVTLTFVEGAVSRVENIRAGPRLDAVSEGSGIAAQFAGLEVRAAQFEKQQRGCSGHR